MLLAPLIPYVEVPELTLVGAGALGGGHPSVPISIKPFGMLVATGVYVGVIAVLRQARRLGFDRSEVVSLLTYVLVAGFVGGHLGSVLWYFPERVLHDPWSLLRIWEGQSSMGGFAGSVMGGWLWKLGGKRVLLPYADLVCSSLPFGWAFGRAGCSLVHDHPGMVSEAWFAVRFPDGGRIDLGLMEFAFTVVVAGVFLVLRRRPRPWGFYAGLLALAYGPHRFALDFLRPVQLPRTLGAADARYGALTPAQWGCIALAIVGPILLWRALGRSGDPDAIRPPRSGT